MSSMAITEKEAKRYKEYLEGLISQVQIHLAEIDIIMKQSESNKRGKQIAYSCNKLELSKDRAKHFGLGLDLTKKK